MACLVIDFIKIKFLKKLHTLLDKVIVYRKTESIYPTVYSPEEIATIENSVFQLTIFKASSLY